MDSRAPELRAVELASRKVRRSRDEYRRALLEARDAGLSVVEIARAAGVTRQAVYKTLGKEGGQ